MRKGEKSLLKYKMNRIQINIPIDLVEELFARSKYLDHLVSCSTLILELKTCMERGMVHRLGKGFDVSLTQSFEDAVSDLVDFDSDNEISWY